MKRVILLIGLALMLAAPTLAVDADSPAGKCMTCHKEKSPGLYRQWFTSKHGSAGVTCIDCHGANSGEADAYMHEGALIATLVTPKDCAACHEKESQEVQDSYHAHAGEILDSKDAYLAHAAGGHPVAIVGCESCHGAKVIIDPDATNKLSRLTWPNSGIGRINPDGSKGACTACHTRHTFDVAQARKPESCSKCHLGPDHPQKEVYEESKHGNTYYTNIDKMNLDSDRWVVGVDYFEAPTCATCHMSATPTQPVTHEVGARISWTLRPPVSKTKDNWEIKRQNMQDVCRNCHGQGFVDGHYEQFDGLVEHVQREVRQADRRQAAQDRQGEEGWATAPPATFSNKYRVDLLGDLAPRGSPRASRRRHDVARTTPGGTASTTWPSTSTSSTCPRCASSTTRIWTRPSTRSKPTRSTTG
jgi:hydroxylamine dehydrogenase